MKRQLYYPSRQGDQIAWLNNFRHKLAGYADTLALTPETLASAMADLVWIIHFQAGLLESIRRYGLACTSATKALMSGKGTSPVVVPPFEMPEPPVGIAPVPPGALNRIFKLIRTIKATPGYTNAIGLDLGIVGNLHRTGSPVPTFDLKITRGASGECVKGTFSRHGHRAVHVECRRGEGDWEQLGNGVFPGSTFLDKRPLLDPDLPEVREYRLRFWDDDKPNGDWTAVSSVTVSP